MTTAEPTHLRLAYSRPPEKPDRTAGDRMTAEERATEQQVLERLQQSLLRAQAELSAASFWSAVLERWLGSLDREPHNGCSRTKPIARKGGGVA
jgi:hypothetical protein